MRRELYKAFMACAPSELSMFGPMSQCDVYVWFQGDKLSKAEKRAGAKVQKNPGTPNPSTLVMNTLQQGATWTPNPRSSEYQVCNMCMSRHIITNKSHAQIKGAAESVAQPPTVQ